MASPSVDAPALREAASFFAVVGHRGAPIQEVENTLPSFRAAVAQGANGIEADLCVTRDAEVVVWHDFNPHSFDARLRRLGLEPDVRYRPYSPDDSRYQRCVDELSLSELRQHHGYGRKTLLGGRVDAHIPTLDELMQFAAKQREVRIVFLDLKLPSRRAELLSPLLTRLDRLVAELRPAFEIVLETAYPAIVQALRELAPRYPTALDVLPPPGLVLRPEKFSATRAALANGANWATAQKPRFATIRGFETHLDVARYDVGVLERTGRESGRAAIDGLCCFTINQRHQMRQLIDLGVSAIQSDAPGLLRQVTQECGRSASTFRAEQDVQALEAAVDEDREGAPAT